MNKLGQHLGTGIKAMARRKEDEMSGEMGAQGDYKAKAERESGGK